MTTTLTEVIDAAACYADWTPPRCVLCGCSAEPGVRGSGGSVCVPCGLARPRLAMTLRPIAGRRYVGVFIGDTRLGAVDSHPSGRWIATDGTSHRYTDDLDAALDALASLRWGWEE